MKTLAAVVIIVIACLMAWGIKSVADKNKAATEISNNQLPMTNQVPINNNQETNRMQLEIVSPGGVVSTKNVTLVGRTEPMAEVVVDDKETKADKEGNFSVKLVLDEGENEIVVTANNEDGEYVEKSVKISYEPVE